MLPSSPVPSTHGSTPVPEVDVPLDIPEYVNLGTWLRIGIVTGNGRAFDLFRRRDYQRPRTSPFEYRVRDNINGVFIHLEYHEYLSNNEEVDIPGFGPMVPQLLSPRDCKPCHYI